MYLVSSTFSMWYWIVVGVIALVAVLIHAGIDNDGAFDLEDFFDTFFGEGGWITLLVILGLGGLVYAFIWNWLVMLFITIGLIIVSGIVLKIAFGKMKDNKKENYQNYNSSNSEEEDGEEDEEREEDDEWEEEGEYIDIDPEYDEVEDFVDNPYALACFSLSQLREYCEDNELPDYKKMTKKEIINLIVHYNEVDEFIEPSVNDKTHQNIKELVVKPNNKGIMFKDIAGLIEAKEAFREKVILPFEHPEIFAKYGKKAGGGILLYGLPGTGKTMFAEAAANELNALFISLKCSDIKSKWYGESEQKVKSVFEKARKEKRAIIFFDEFEVLGSKRTDNRDNLNNDLIPEILSQMQGVGTNKVDSTIMVIAATNRPWSIDSAFLRPGRFDEKIYIPLPDYEARKTLFKLQFSKLPVENIDYDYLARITENYNGADIKEVCEKLKMQAIKDTLNKGSEQLITMEYVHAIESTFKSSVSNEDIQRIKEFEDYYNGY